MSKRHFWGFAALEITYWCFHASFICYAPAFFLDNGISNTVVSFLLAAYMLCAFAGAIVWGAVCDTLGTNKKVFMLGLSVSAALLYVIYFFGHSAPLMAIAYPALGFFFVAQSANAEAWILSACHHNHNIFGPIRAMPSLAYAVWVAGVGRMIDVRGYAVMPLWATVFFVAVMVAALMLPDARPVRREEKTPVFTRAQLADLFGNRVYRQLIVLLFVLGLAIAPVNNLKVVVMEGVGGSLSDVGADAFVCALTQVPFFLLAGRILRVPLRTRYMLMTALPFAMILLCLFASSPVMIILGSAAYNAAFGILLPTMREVTERNVQDKLRNLAHSLSDAVFNNFSAVVSLAYAGVVIDGIGVSAMLVISAIIAAGAFVFGFIFTRA